MLLSQIQERQAGGGATSNRALPDAEEIARYQKLRGHGDPAQPPHHHHHG
jgi:hypothetical protein